MAPRSSIGLGDDRAGLFSQLIGDGRPLLLLTGVLLILSGGFALFLSATGHFLPHHVAFLGMTPEELCAVNECRIVHFMIHDRVAFGGALIGVGTLYLWLVAFPLAQGQEWAWWLLVVSGVLGFGSFLLYLGYGYLDTWHGFATLGLLPCFVLGLVKAHGCLGSRAGLRALVKSGEKLAWTSAFGLGRLCLLTTALGLAAGGLTIMLVGITTIFVPQDIQFIGLAREQLQAVNPRLLPLIAHDRAGFGGGVCCSGVTIFLALWCARPSRSLWQSLLITGIAGFGTAIGVHPAIGYTDFLHLAPAYLGAALFAAGLIMTYPRMWQPVQRESSGSQPMPRLDPTHS